MDPIRISKFLSYVLRHRPDEIGITLDEQGWVPIDILLAAAGRAGTRITRAELDDVVATNDKKRFALSEDGLRIRASQGHSVEVELGLPPVEPPDILFHGTVERFLDSIRRTGLVKGSRQHVHLSRDEATATRVGERRGRPALLKVRAGDMHRAGHLFHLSANAVWLTDTVPPQYIDFQEAP